MALFRYDLDSAGVIGDSALILIPVASASGAELLRSLERAATRLAEMLAEGEPPRRVYTVKGTSLEPVPADECVAGRTATFD